MTKEIWINLPVKDLAKSKAFFSSLGFSFHPRHENSDKMAALMLGEKGILVMLFPESTFGHFTGHPVTDTSGSAEVLFSFDAESREEVDEMANKVTDAGGTIFSGPGENEGWMYGFGFADPDGHRWNMLYMDMSLMPEGT